MNVLPLAVLAFATAAADIGVHIAPDQPIPVVYADEPIIVEFTSDSPVTFDATIAITGGNTPEYRTTFEELRIRGSGQHWVALEDFPGYRGRFTAEIDLSTGGGRNSVHEFCRVDRPFLDADPPVGVEMERLDPAQLQALLGVPLQVVRLYLTGPDVETQLSAAGGVGLRVALAVDLAGISAAGLEAAAARYGDKVSQWELDAHGDSGALLTATEALRRGGVRSGISLVVNEPAAVGEALRNGGGRHLRGLVIKEDAPDGDTLAAYRRAAEEAGYEGLQLTVLSGQAEAKEEEGEEAEENPASKGPALVRRLVRHGAAGIAFTHLNVPALLDGGQFFPGYVHLSGLAHRLQKARYIGPLLADDAEAHVFRSRGQWIVALWRDGESGDVTLETGDVSDLRFKDALNNELTAPAISDGSVTLRAGPEPRYLQGRGGDVLRIAAGNVAQREAQAFLDEEAFQDQLSSELHELIESIAGNGGHKPERLEFFTLLRAFPYLEEQWHMGGLPRSTAAPATANLQRLSRALCVLEEESGEAFIEPLQDLLAKSSEYQSVYLTSVGNQTSTHPRGNWLLQEVSRLTEEARALDDEGRSIEAAAVAALAEWRARSLEYTVLGAEVEDDEDEDGGDEADAE